MGPKKRQDMSRGAGLIDEEDVRIAENGLTVFPSGWGDYLAVDVKRNIHAAFCKS